jgi:GT2 family glycosyltransferase
VSPPTIRTSVLVCAFAEERLEDTVHCVNSALAQVPPPSEVIVVVDHNPSLAGLLRERLSDEVRISPNTGQQGLSSARNTGIGMASGDVIAFLDDDAVAQPGWMETLGSAFADPAVAGAGGRAVAAWDVAQPAWFPNEFLWVVGCSYSGQPAAGEVRNPLGCNMAFRREVFDRAGMFDVQIGRLGARPLGCEETELCIRARKQIPAARFVLVSGADVLHRVPQARGQLDYFLRRCFYEGISKALVRALGGTRSLDIERTYVIRALPEAILRASWESLIGPDRRGAAGRIAAIVAGLLTAVGGYVVGGIKFRLRARRR